MNGRNSIEFTPFQSRKVTSERRQTRDGTELVVCRVLFARVSCLWLIFGTELRSFKIHFGELIHLSLLVCSVVLGEVRRRSRRQREVAGRVL